MKQEPDLTKYCQLLGEFRTAVRLDPSYAITVATAGGALIGKRAARAGIPVDEYHELREEIEAREVERRRELLAARRGRELERRREKRAMFPRDPGLTAEKQRAKNWAEIRGEMTDAPELNPGAS